MEQTRKPPYSRRELVKFLAALDDELRRRGSDPIELNVGGGFVMARQMRFRYTNDIDVLGSELPRSVRAAARYVAFQYGIASDWINDAAKGVDLPVPASPSIVFEGSVLRVVQPGPRYILASKLKAHRDKDLQDCLVLVKQLRLRQTDIHALLAQACGGEARITPDQTRFAERIARKTRRRRKLRMFRLGTQETSTPRPQPAQTARCGKLMPIARRLCSRPRGHTGPCQ